MSSEPVRFGILSSANIGVKAVAPAILASANSRLLAVGSRDVQRAADLYAFAPDVAVYDGYERVLQDPAIEAVYIPLPNGLHAKWTIKALQAGKHVLCEKPLGATLDEAREMAALAQEKGLILMEAFMYRFHPQIVWALEQVRAGVIGAVRQVRASFTIDIREQEENIRLQPELAGGSLMDVGCYPVNFCRAVYGRPPVAIAARVQTAGPVGVDLTTNAVLDYGEGCFALIDSSLVLPMRQIAEIIGELGMITLPVPFTTGNHEAVVFVTKNGQMDEQTFERVDQYRLEIEHFAECVRTGREPSFSLSESLENAATIEGIYAAAGLDWPLV